MPTKANTGKNLTRCAEHKINRNSIVQFFCAFKSSLELLLCMLNTHK